MYQEPILPTLSSNSNGLACPNCNGDCLHHQRVEVFERISNDASEGLHVTVKNTKVNVDTDMKGNPSGRRNGMFIEFWCETCDEKPVLNIYQHKGPTYMEWEASNPAVK